MPQADPMQIAVVIPVGGSQHRLLPQCLAETAKLTYEPRTILVVSEEPMCMPDDPHFINLVTHAGTLTSPGYKRDFARRHFPDADVYACLDDDAYPPPHWLEAAVQVLQENPNAAGTGGPGLVPADQTYWERVSGAVLEMYAGSGPLRFRVWPDSARDCDDFPGYDLILRKVWLDAVGGWATDWYGGEDTTLCAKMADKGGVIRYDPRVAVFHYRRPLLPDHARQMANVGRARGCLMRTGQSRSRRAVFVLPLVFCLSALALVAVPLLLRAPAFALALSVCAYLALALFGHPGRLPLGVRLAAPAGLLVQHAAYACGLIAGLASGKPNRTTWAARRSDPARAAQRAAL